MERIDLAFFGYISIATLCVAITIVLVTNRHAWMPVVGRFMSLLSGDWRASLERARQQKAARDAIYGYATVNDYQDGGRDQSRVMSRENTQTHQTHAPDADGRHVFADDPWIARLKVDRTKMALIEVMVYSGWTVPEIRSIIKGENGAIGTDVETARQRLGIQPATQYVTPFVGRPTSARFETDPDYPYQAPA